MRLISARSMFPEVEPPLVVVPTISAGPIGAVHRDAGTVHALLRYVAGSEVLLEGGRVATNRTFDADGNETTAAPSAFGAHVFGTRVLSPADRWMLELPADKNAWFATVSPADIVEMDYSELADVVLALEYEETT